MTPGKCPPIYTVIIEDGDKLMAVKLHLIQITPTQIDQGSPAFTLTIIGSNFINGSVATVNDVARPTTCVSGCELNVSVPDLDVHMPGPVRITVQPRGAHHWDTVILTVLETPYVPPANLVPDVVGVTQAEGQTTLTSAGLLIGTVTTASSDTVAAGSIISQSPAGGTVATPMMTVDLVVSSGPAPLPISVPQVTLLTQAAATTAITAAGLVLGTITTMTNALTAGLVISQDPIAGTLVNAGASVALVVSSGSPPTSVAVPNVVNLTQAAATTAIQAVALVVGTVTSSTDAVIVSGHVISQSPAATTVVALGSAVSLVISTGPPVPGPVAVPNVVNSTQAAATTAITGAGLVLGSVSSAPHAVIVSGNVISENPAAGTLVVLGSSVSIVVSTGPAVTPPVTVPNIVNTAQAAAQASLIAVGLTVGTVTQASNAVIVSGNVISQNPAAAASVPVGTAVSFVVSTGPVVIPTPTVGTWVAFANSSLRPAMYAAPGFATPWNPAYIMDYSGGAYDSVRDEYIVWGGGHGDYSGNEVCRFNLSTGVWTCGTRSDPGPPVPGGDGIIYNSAGGTYTITTKDVLTDGTAAARHTYGSMAWIPQVGGFDGFFVHGGSLSGGGFPTYGAWFYHRDTLTWEQMPSTLNLFGQSESNSKSLTDFAVWDSVRQVVHVQVRGGMRDFVPATRTWVDRGAFSDCTDCEIGRAYDEERQQFLLIGKNTTILWDTSTQPWTRVGMSITGDTTPVTTKAPGLIFDPVNKNYVAYVGGKNLYTINRDTWVSTLTVGGGDDPGPAFPDGTYTRFQYVPSQHSVIVVNSVDSNVCMYKLPAGPTGSIPAKTFVLLDAPIWNGQYLIGGDGTTGNRAITYHDKHVQGCYCPDDGKIYFMGGDYYSASYRNEIWALDVAARLAAPDDPNAGWELVNRYCRADAGFQPKGPDFPGWTWDTSRHVFWLIPGEMDPHGQFAALCPGEIPDSYTDNGNLLFGHIMTFDPVTRLWADKGFLGKKSTRSATYDAVTDTIVAPGPSNDMGVYNCTTGVWTYYPVAGSTSWAANIWAADLPNRKIYIVDAEFRGLIVWDMDLHTFTIIAASPCQPLPSSTVQSDKGYLVFDSTNHIVIQNCYQGTATFAYHIASNIWEDISSFPMTDPMGNTPRWNTSPYTGGGVGTVQWNAGLTYDPVNNWVVGLGWQGVWLFKYA